MLDLINEEDIEGEQGFVRFLPGIYKGLKLFLKTYNLSYRGDKYRLLAEKGFKTGFKKAFFFGVNLLRLLNKKYWSILIKRLILRCMSK